MLEPEPGPIYKCASVRAKCQSQRYMPEPELYARARAKAYMYTCTRARAICQSQSYMPEPEPEPEPEAQPEA